jgi:hypothetical protein
MKVVVRKQKGSLKRLRRVYMETDSFAEFFHLFALGTIFDKDARHWSRFMPRHPPPIPVGISCRALLGSGVSKLCLFPY